MDEAASWYAKAAGDPRTALRFLLELRAVFETIAESPRAFFEGPAPTDVAKKHDADLYGDLDYEELDRRMRSVRDGTATLVPWDKARKELLSPPTFVPHPDDADAVREGVEQAERGDLLSAGESEE